MALFLLSTGQNATPKLKLDLPERVYAMAISYPVMVVGKFWRVCVCLRFAHGTDCILVAETIGTPHFSIE